MNAPNTVIIGGGIAGLATAILLAREGHHVTLLEQRQELGGRAATYSEAGFRFELGPSWYLMPGVFDHFYELAGTSTAEQLKLVQLDPAYRVFPEGSPAVTIPAGRENVAQVFESLEPGSSPKLARHLASAQETNDLALDYFLYNPFTSWRSILPAAKHAPTLLKLLFTSLDSYVAKRFKHPVLRQILGYPAVFLGTSPKAAPAMYHLMSTLDLDEGVLYPMGGFTGLVASYERLARDAGVHIITGATVTKIATGPVTTRPVITPLPTSPLQRRTKKPAQVQGVVWQDRQGLQHTLPADYVVSAADLHHTETQLLPRSLQTYPQRWWDRRTSGPGAVIITLGIEGKLPQLPHHSLFFTKDWDANFEAIFGADKKILNPTSIYVCKPSATDPTVAPEGQENLFILVPVPAEPTTSDITQAVLNQLAQWADIPDLHERILTQRTIGPADFASEYNSWHGGMLGPAHILSQSAMFRAQNESKKVAGLYYAGATTAPGVGVPMCLISAELVLKRIRGDRSAGAL